MITKQMRSFYKQFSQCGKEYSDLSLSPKDVVLLIHISYLDVYKKNPEWFIPAYAELAKKNFYDIRQVDINKLPSLTVEDAIGFLELSGATIATNIIYLYLKNLSSLWFRRFKYSIILQNQRFPDPEQTAPRVLLEYGNCNNDLLYTWITWRKLIFDLDNRSAQETGYLFEPILASCLGGESVSHSRSPVKRLDETGQPTSKGRQIDCYIPERSEVYELKLRVTIAASGQGRFKEECSFPHEAKAAGLKPILVVFDSTESSLMKKLSKEYIDSGGSVYIGDKAWELLEKQSGDEMGEFIKKYIKPPVSNFSEFSFPLLDSKIILQTNHNELTISDGNNEKYLIFRNNESITVD